MAQFFQIHPENPQVRLARQAADIIRSGGVAVYPTDATYALGCCLGDKNAMERIRNLRQLPKQHNFTLICRDLSELATYARVDNQTFRLLKAHTPSPMTFLLEASSEVPRRLMHPKRKTIGLRVPDNPIVQALLAELDEPMMSTSLHLPNDDYPLTDPYEMRDILEHHVDLILDGGYGGMEPTTVVDLTSGTPELVREGCGDFAAFA